MSRLPFQERYEKLSLEPESADIINSFFSIKLVWLLIESYMRCRSTAQLTLSIKGRSSHVNVPATGCCICQRWVAWGSLHCPLWCCHNGVKEIFDLGVLRHDTTKARFKFSEPVSSGSSSLVSVGVVGVLRSGSGFKEIYVWGDLHLKRQG